MLIRPAPGLLRKRERIRSFGNDVNAITHDSSTLGGNSGSCLVDLDTQQVIGLHFSGRYLEANLAIVLGELTKDPLIKKAKLNFV